MHIGRRDFITLLGGAMRGRAPMLSPLSCPSLTLIPQPTDQ
jgi:hypothetical protein